MHRFRPKVTVVFWGFYPEGELQPPAVPPVWPLSEAVSTLVRQGRIHFLLMGSHVEALTAQTAQRGVPQTPEPSRCGGRTSWEGAVERTQGEKPSQPAAGL